MRICLISWSDLETIIQRSQGHRVMLSYTIRVCESEVILHAAPGHVGSRTRSLGFVMVEGYNVSVWYLFFFLSLSLFLFLSLSRLFALTRKEMSVCMFFSSTPFLYFPSFLLFSQGFSRREREKKRERERERELVGQFTTLPILTILSSFSRSDRLKAGRDRLDTRGVGVTLGWRQRLVWGPGCVGVCEGRRLIGGATVTSFSSGEEKKNVNLI